MKILFNISGKSSCWTCDIVDVTFLRASLNASSFTQNLSERGILFVDKQWGPVQQRRWEVNSGGSHPQYVQTAVFVPVWKWFQLVVGRTVWISDTLLTTFWKSRLSSTAGCYSSI